MSGSIVSLGIALVFAIAAIAAGLVLADCWVRGLAAWRDLHPSDDTGER